MKRRAQIFALRVAIAAVRIPLVLSSSATWQLESVHARLQTKLQNLEANEQD